MKRFSKENRFLRTITHDLRQARKPRCKRRFPVDPRYAFLWGVKGRSYLAPRSTAALVVVF